MSQLVAALALWLIGLDTPQAPPATSYHLIPGAMPPDRGPDGNSVFLEAPDGLILVDTGRHPEHSARLLAYARERGRPIVALFNSHWHMDHLTGNVEVRAAWPNAAVYASPAVEEALDGVLRRSRDTVAPRLAGGQIPEVRRSEVARFVAVMDNPAALRPSHPVTASSEMTIGGRRLQVNLARHAASAGDVWLYDEAAGLVVAGDLVVSLAPFMDSACPDGWRRALDEIAATRFTTLIPGHGDPMSRDQFLGWRTAFNNLLDCGASDRPRGDCIAGWRRDAAAFIPAGREAEVDEAVGYDFDSRIRAAPEARNRFCPAQAAG